MKIRLVAGVEEVDRVTRERREVVDLHQVEHELDLVVGKKLSPDALVNEMLMAMCTLLERVSVAHLVAGTSRGEFKSLVELGADEQAFTSLAGREFALVVFAQDITSRDAVRQILGQAVVPIKLSSEACLASLESARAWEAMIGPHPSVHLRRGEWLTDAMRVAGNDVRRTLAPAIAARVRASMESAA